MTLNARRFDKGGDNFYDQISALHKSVRGSNPDAALYWFCRMLDGGADPKYLSRRIVRMAWEDMRTDDYGAVRASRGLYVTTHAGSAGSQPLDVREARQQLVSAESVIEAMSQASQTHQAESLMNGHDALKKFTDATQNSVPGAQAGGRTAGGGTGNANVFKSPVMLVASPSGIALSTQESVHVSSDEQTNLISGQSTFIASGKSLVASVAEKISLFVQNAGMKLFAAKGKVEIQAHSDDIELIAQKTVKVLSATEKIEVAAQQEILLTSGGAYIRIKDGNIEIHAPGKVDVKGASHAFTGPTQLHTNLGAFKPTAGPYDEALQFKDELGKPLPNLDHLLQMRGDLMKTVASDQGSISRVFSQSPDPIQAYLHVPNIQVGADQFE
nr:DUF2345 domain-containing protein [Burkholderia gladioli]